MTAACKCSSAALRRSVRSAVLRAQADLSASSCSQARHHALRRSDEGLASSTLHAKRITHPIQSRRPHSGTDC
jgi:hypothetical protein